mmetsp:Transcript_40623/g.85019  ORF Transcript_40623/g.85019 Transcript_40623/m.85019 type:complete len:281 (-) Transcript_40623:1594-2436(-)
MQSRAGSFEAKRMTTMTMTMKTNLRWVTTPSCILSRKFVWRIICSRVRCTDRASRSRCPTSKSYRFPTTISRDSFRENSAHSPICATSTSIPITSSDRCPDSWPRLPAAEHRRRRRRRPFYSSCGCRTTPYRGRYRHRTRDSITYATFSSTGTNSRERCLRNCAVLASTPTFSPGRRPFQKTRRRKNNETTAIPSLVRREAWHWRGCTPAPNAREARRRVSRIDTWVRRDDVPIIPSERYSKCFTRPRPRTGRGTASAIGTIRPNPCVKRQESYATLKIA